MAICSRHPGKKLTSVSPCPHPVRYHFLAQSALIKISGADFPLSYHCHPRAIWPHPSLFVLASPKSNVNFPVGQFHQHRIPHPKYCHVFHICAFQQTFSHLLGKSSYPLSSLYKLLQMTSNLASWWRLLQVPQDQVIVTSSATTLFFPQNSILALVTLTCNYLVVCLKPTS